MGTGKVMTLDAALQELVRPGDHLHLAFSQARAIAAVNGLVRRFGGSDPRFTISAAGLASVHAALVSESLVERLICSFAADTFPNPAPNPVFQRAVDSGAVALEETSLWTVAARVMAGALGVPFVPVRSLVGSDLARQPWVAEISDPFTRAPATVVGAIVPDLTIVHGAAADEDGNVILAPPYGEGNWGSLAARRGVIATVERVLDRASVRRYQTLVTIPNHQVRAVCELPFGAHPFGLYSPISEVGGYGDDERFIGEQRQACATAESYHAWVKTWVYEPRDHTDYLRLLGDERLAQLAADSAPSARVDVAIGSQAPPSAEECMVLEAARMIEDRVSRGGANRIMTGIGFANLAVWVAHRRLTDLGASAQLMAEIGAYGFEPAPGDPFVFSQRNLPSCSWMGDVTSVLGSILHAGAGKTLAVLSAGTVDAKGNINSSRTSDGGYLVGSGGANDIATCSSEVLVVLKHGRSRLVPEVSYVTCPGRNVTTIITTKGVLRRDGHGRFVLTAVPARGRSLDEAIKDAALDCGWPLEVAREVVPFAPADVEQLAHLRAFDPRHFFLPSPR